MRLFVCLCVLALAGCDVFSGGPDAAFTASVERPDVLLSLKNTGDEAIEVGSLPCAVTLEVETDGRWQDSDHEPLIVCTDVLIRIEPGETEEATYPMKDVPNGMYRFRVTIAEEGNGSTREVVTNEIQVASAAG